MESPFHFVMEILAMYAGVELYLRSRVRDALTGRVRIAVLFGAGVGALLGSRLVGALEDPAQFLHPTTLLYYYANKTIIGGIAGGILGVEAVKRYLGIHTRTGDRVIMPLAVAIVIGRIGCFVTGVTDGTVGGPCDYAWCLDQGDSILRHPNSLYEIAFLLLFLLVHHLYLSKWPKAETSPGLSFRIFIAAYFSFRFMIEFLKETHPLFLGLNSIQLVCAAVLLWYAYDIARVSSPGKSKGILLG